MHDKPVTPVAGSPAEPSSRVPPRLAASPLRLVVGGPAPATAAMRPLDAGELRRVTGGPAAHPTPCRPPVGKPR